MISLKEVLRLTLLSESIALETVNPKSMQIIEIKDPCTPTNKNKILRSIAGINECGINHFTDTLATHVPLLSFTMLAESG